MTQKTQKKGFSLEKLTQNTVFLLRYLADSVSRWLRDWS